jgi:hypothetical protein
LFAGCKGNVEIRISQYECQAPLPSVFSAGGPPFFGLLFDYTQSYFLSFGIFIGMLFASAFLSLFLRPPKK